MHNTTIVTALITNINENRSIEKYIEYGNQLLEIDLPKVIFIEKHIYELYYKSKYENNNNVFIMTDKSQLYLYNYKDKITNFKVHTNNPKKDTIEYMFIQCNKTEWIKEAIELNHFNTEQYIWVDFGIYHMINDTDIFQKYMQMAADKTYENVRIASCWNPMNCTTINLYENITWYFAGSVFGGNKDKLLLFADLMRKKCMQIICEKNTLMWEVNIWYFIYKENLQLFDCYNADHNPSIIGNW